LAQAILAQAVLVHIAGAVSGNSTDPQFEP